VLPPTTTRRHRWMETTFEETRSGVSLRDAVKRPATTFRPTVARCSDTSACCRPEGRWHLERSAPTADPVFTPKPARMLPDLAARGCRHLRTAHAYDSCAGSPATLSTASAGGREATLTDGASSPGLGPWSASRHPPST
jgi:hypothetical protein